MLNLGWIEPDYAEKKKKELFSTITQELKRASSEKLPPIDDLFNDVYHTIPPHLEEQRQELLAHLKVYGEKYKGIEKFKDYR